MQGGVYKSNLPDRIYGLPEDKIASIDTILYFITSPKSPIHHVLYFKIFEVLKRNLEIETKYETFEKTTQAIGFHHHTIFTIL